MTRITIDPITRIEGHLRIDCEVEDGKVTNAWASGQMWRGIETILKGRDPRDAWVFAQRICGVCTTVHAIVSVRAVENALDMEIPLNAQYIRNLIMAAHGVHDHIVHFYQLAGLDWVDIVSALKADPAATAKLGQSLSGYRHNSVQEIKAIKDKFATFVGSGQLGVFASGYWGHPAMKLPPEVNLLAAVHDIQALEYQRSANKIVSILGAKTPHIQNLAVGGVANPINPESQSTLTLERLYAVKAEIDKLGEFVNEALLPDVGAVGALYADWTQYGKGITNYLSVPDMPLDTKGTQFELPGGYIDNGDLAGYRPITSHRDEFFRDGVKEGVKHAWYEYEGGDQARHPWDGQTNPKYTDFQDEGKYSWVKSPTFYDKRAQVGPLAHILAMYVAGHEPTKRHADRLLAIASKVAGSPIGLDALHSTIGRGASGTGGGPVRVPAKSVATADGQYRQGRLRYLQSPGLPQGRDPRLRVARGPARHALSLGRHRERQDQELPGRRAHHLERRTKRRQRPDRSLRGITARQPRGRSGGAAGGPAHCPLLRSLPGLRHPYGGRQAPPHRSGEDPLNHRLTHISRS